LTGEYRGEIILTNLKIEGECMKYKFTWGVTLVFGILAVWFIDAMLADIDPSYMHDHLLLTILLWSAGGILGNIYLPNLGSITYQEPGEQETEMLFSDYLIWAVIIGLIGPSFLLIISGINWSISDWSRP
jgi:hypothetical protein